jgi:hypothetical protein
MNLTALIVGGDRLGNIPKLLMNKGFSDYIHWKGRKKGLRNKKIPTNVDIVIVLYDFIEHSLTQKIKSQTKSMNIPCLFTRRSCIDLNKLLNSCNTCKHMCLNNTLHKNKGSDT